MSRPVVPDRHVALVGGLLACAAGAWLLSQAFESRGRKRPYLLRLLPGGG